VLAVCEGVIVLAVCGGVGGAGVHRRVQKGNCTACGSVGSRLHVMAQKVD